MTKQIGNCKDCFWWEIPDESHKEEAQRLMPGYGLCRYTPPVYVVGHDNFAATHGETDWCRCFKGQEGE